MDIYKLIIILLFCIYNLYLYITGDIGNYISQRFFTASLAASIVGTTISLVGIIYFIAKEKNKKELINSLAPFLTLTLNIILGLIINPLFLLISIPIFYILKKDIKIKFDLGILLVIVIVLGFAIPSTSLTSVTAYQREGDYNSVSLTERSSTISRFADTKSYDIGDWIAAINYNPDIKLYNGKEVNIVGFVFQPESYDSQYFLASRFVITCCAVDARPIGLIVKKEDWQSQYKLDDWLMISGKFSIENLNGVDQLVVIPSAIEKTVKPERPYIY